MNFKDYMNKTKSYNESDNTKNENVFINNQQKISEKFLNVALRQTQELKDIMERGADYDGKEKINNIAKSLSKALQSLAACKVFFTHRRLEADYSPEEAFNILNKKK